MKMSVAVPVVDNSQIGEARRAALQIAEAIGCDETRCGKVALLVTEAATNLVRHGGGGEIVLQTAPNEEPDYLQILALDKGPGMANVAQCLQDGYSTGGTAGQGLGAIQRGADEFDIFSAPGMGTVLFAGFYAQKTEKPRVASPWQIGVISLAKTGESDCGDSFSSHIGNALGNDLTGGSEGALPLLSRFIVADGLGHGPLASEASCEAIRIFDTDAAAASSPVRLMETIHAALRSTRGAAVSTAYIDESAQQVRFVGVGNVAAALLTPETQQGMAAHNGTAGAQIYKLQEFTYPFPPRAVLVLASDGVSTQWRIERYPGLLNRHPAIIAGMIYRDCSRGRDDVTVFAARKRPKD